MKTCLLVLSCCFVIGALFAYGQSAEEGFQTARVVDIERLPLDGQHPERADQYKMTMRLGDIMYNCRANAPAATFMGWTMNKEFPAKVSGKTMLVKNFDGQIVQLTITGTKKPK